jgi:hypothetical protein
MQLAWGREESGLHDGVDIRTGPFEHRKKLIRAQQAEARARLAATSCGAARRGVIPAGCLPIPATASPAPAGRRLPSNFNVAAGAASAITATNGANEVKPRLIRDRWMRAHSDECMTDFLPGDIGCHGSRQ